MTDVAARPRNPLQFRDFRFLWLNSLTFYMVANALRFVYGWVVLDGLDGDESAQGFAVFLLGLPGIFLLLPAGVWADRLDSRRMLLATQIGTICVMVATAAVLARGHLSMTVIVVSALAAGATTALGSPVRSSLIPQLLPKDVLFGGIALNALALTVSLVLGALTAQLVGDQFGFDGSFWYLAILLAVGTSVLVPMRTPAKPPVASDRPTMRQAVGEGMRFVYREPALRILFFMLGLSGLVMNVLMFVTLQAFVKEELGRDAGDAAPLLAIMGVGLAISSIIVVRRGDMKNKGTLFLRAMMGGTTILTIMGFTTAYWQLAVLALLMGMCGGFFINMNQGLIQANTPPELMGRVMGFYTLVQGGLTPVGALLIGILASIIGPALAMVISAASALAIVIFVYVTTTELHELQT